ncbi:M56 family metallopeptidase [Sphingomonas sp.]|uniref:M56 family metallopeptidase n=1 Tax=Sphingomonas sp. TaxID=28214 RepID=UPI00333FE246
MIGWGIEALVASTVLMIAVLLLRVPIRKAFGAQIAYALWLLPVLRLVLPPLPAAWWQATAVAPVQRATEQMTILFVAPVAESAVPNLPILGSLLGPALAVLWVAGAAAFIGWHTVAHHRFCRRLLDRASAQDRAGGVQIIETEAASGPLAFGVWRRYVAFPRDFAERYEPEERDLALVHELGHHARGDLIANWIALVVLALHWFNPIAWRAFRAFRADQEIANDARVLAGMNPMRRHSYACAILKAAHPTFLGGTVSATCHLHTIDDLKGRLRMLTTIKTSRVRLLTGAGALALLVTGGLGLTASGTAAAAKVRSSVERATGVDLVSLDQAAPASPAPPAESAEAAPPAPPAPPAPLVTKKGGTTIITTAAPDGKEQRKVIRIIRRSKDGTVTTDDLGDWADLDPIRCKTDSKAGEMIKTFEKNGKKIVLICSDLAKVVAHSEAIAANGAAMAANSKTMERNAYTHALSGLRDARARMLASPGMSADERKRVLEGIDIAIKEIEGDLAKVE